MVTPDWEAIETAYRAGVMSLREIASQHGISEGAIRKRAKRDDWSRDLNAKVTGVTLTPTTSTGAAGGTSMFTVNIAPADASNKGFTIATTDATKATATASGNTVTVTRVATGTAQIVVNTVEGNKVATHTVTVS